MQNALTGADMPALQHDIVIEKGATFERVFSCTVIATGEPFDATNCTITAEMTGGDALAFETFGSVGAIKIRLTDEQTDTLTTVRNPQKTYIVEATTPAGDVYRIAEGTVTVK